MKTVSYHPRAMEPVLEAALQSHPVVVLSGARQTGKTTLVQHTPSAQKRLFQTFDDLEVLDLGRRHPEEVLERHPYITLDEVQRVPEILLAVKKAVDRHRQQGQFLLTGSANLLLMRQVADSLAGRAVYLQLSPFTLGEKLGNGTAPLWSLLLSCRSAPEAVDLVAGQRPQQVDWAQEALQGGMPPVVFAESAEERHLWLDGFIRTYLERDLQTIAQISALPDFRRLMRLAAHRTGQLVNQTELGRDAGVAQATTHRYLNLLEATFQLHRLSAFAVNATKRLIKTPKLYWTDTGIGTHLAGIGDEQSLRESPLAGAFLENRILSAFLAWRETTTPRPDIFYWRTAGGAEIDFVVEQGTTLLPVEVKTARRVSVHDTRHLGTFLTDYAGKTSWAAILHDTDVPHLVTRNIVGLPASYFF